MKTQGVMEVETKSEKQTAARCDNCGSDNIRTANVKSAFWHDDRLVVVDDIPAVVCDNCHEQYFDDHTIVVLDLLRGDGFRADQARSELRVPVFSFLDRLTARDKS